MTRGQRKYSLLISKRRLENGVQSSRVFLASPSENHSDIATLVLPFLFFIQNDKMSSPGSILVSSRLDVFMKEDFGGVWKG